MWMHRSRCPEGSPSLPQRREDRWRCLKTARRGRWRDASTSADEFEPVDPISGTPVIRQGRASNLAAASPFYRIADPHDLLRESTPDLEFGLLQTSDGHQFLLPRPRIQQGATSITTTERSLLADAYARSTSAGLFPKRSSCFAGQVTNELQLTGGRYRLGPATTANFDNIAGGVRAIIEGDALAIRTTLRGTDSLHARSRAAQDVGRRGRHHHDLSRSRTLQGFDGRPSQLPDRSGPARDAARSRADLRAVSRPGHRDRPVPEQAARHRQPVRGDRCSRLVQVPGDRAVPDSRAPETTTSISGR